MKPTTTNKENPMPLYIMVGLVALVAIVALLNGNGIGKNNYATNDLGGQAIQAGYGKESMPPVNEKVAGWWVIDLNSDGSLNFDSLRYEE